MSRRDHTRFRLARALLLVAAGLCLLSSPSGASPPTDTIAHGFWRPVQPGDTAARVLRDIPRDGWRPFDPAQLNTFSSRGLGSWVVLEPAAPGLAGQRVLSIPTPPFGRITLFGNDGQPLTTDSLTNPEPALAGNGRIAFALPADMPATAPILLKFEPGTTLDAPVVFRLQTRTAFRHTDTTWLVMASGSFAVMLAMGLMALVFALMLRNATFAWYACYVAAYAALQAIQTGYVLHPLGLDVLAPVALKIGTALVGLSVVSAVLFMTRFCDLRRLAPWLRLLLLALACMVATLSVLYLLPFSALKGLVQGLLNPLLALCSGLMLLAGSVALFRGSRSALFFLFGWVPLLVLTALTSAQVGGALPGVDWLNEASLAAGAIESLVLAVGLADRTLNLRQEHRRARELADRDPLTGIFNRRGWIDAAQKCMEDGQTHALLFMDLDHFKTLNDELGHTAGDRALVAVADTLAAELRPQDLLGRFGGEEFVALIRDTGREYALLVAERLCRRLHRLHVPRDHAGHDLTLSIGVAIRRPGDSLASLLERSDMAMYEAKSRGRNRVVEESEVHPRTPTPMRRTDAQPPQEPAP